MTEIFVKQNVGNKDKYLYFLNFSHITVYLFLIIKKPFFLSQNYADPFADQSLKER